MKTLFTKNYCTLKSATLVVMFLFAFLFVSVAQESKSQISPELAKEFIKLNQTTGKKYFDNGYIKVDLTGDKKKDEINILSAKEALFKVSPEQYRKMIMSYPVEAAPKNTDKTKLPAAK